MSIVFHCSGPNIQNANLSPLQANMGLDLLPDTNCSE